ncbi:MAG: protein kinase [Planctomycetota bacterium]
MDDSQVTDRQADDAAEIPGGPLSNLVGKTLGTFRLSRVVGQGSMGVVFEAQQETLNRRVALKVLPPSLTTSEKAIQRFLREAESVAQLHHKHIVDIYDIGRAEGLYYYAMRFVEGTSLDRLLQQHRFRPLDAARIIHQAAEAIHFAHQHGIIHRDIKPGNLIITPDGQVVITDFGLARPEKSSSLTESGALVGTPMYMSPEQVRGDRGAVDRRTDIYSLGASLYELLAGQPPFDGKSTQETLQKILDRDPKPPRRIRPDIPWELEVITLKAMEKDPARRYATAGEIAEDLRRFMDGEPILARRSSVITRTGKWLRRHRTVAALFATVLVIAMSGIALALLKSNREAQRNSYAAQIRQADDLLRGRRIEEAIAEYQKARQYDPKSPKSYAGLGLAYYEQALLAEAESSDVAAERAATFFDMALAELNEAMRLGIKDGRVPLRRAKIRMRTGQEGNPQDWIDDIDRAAEMDAYSFEVQLEVANLYLSICQKQDLEHELDFLLKAERWASEAVKTSPRSADARVTRSLIYLNLYELVGAKTEQGPLSAGEYLELARRDCSQAYRLDRNNRTAYELRQTISSELLAKDWRSALIQKGLTLVGEEAWLRNVKVPDDLPTHLFPGFVAMSNPEGESQERARRRDEAENRAKQGQALEREGDFAGALGHYLAALNLWNDLADVHRRVAEIYLQQNRSDSDTEGFFHAQEAERLAPSDLDCIQTYWKAAKKIGNTGEAERMMLKLTGLGTLNASSGG